MTVNNNPERLKMRDENDVHEDRCYAPKYRHAGGASIECNNEQKICG